MPPRYPNPNANPPYSYTVLVSETWGSMESYRARDQIKRAFVIINKKYKTRIEYILATAIAYIEKAVINIDHAYTVYLLFLSAYFPKNNANMIPNTVETPVATPQALKPILYRTKKLEKNIGKMNATYTTW